MSIKVLDDAGLRAKGISYSRQHRDRLIKAGKFPPPIALGSNRVGWIESEIEDWLVERIAARDAALAHPVSRLRGRHLKQTIMRDGGAG
jgi:prophage regulatory protein